MGERRNSDFDLRLDLTPTAPAATPLPSPPLLEDRRPRPSAGRRRSEQSESFGQPAKTRARVEEPKAKRRPATATGIVPPFPVPDLSTLPHSLSPSSTYDSLGPDTPTTLEFLLTPIPTVTCDEPASPPRSGSFPLANPVHRGHHHASSSPRPPSSRSTRSLRQAYRPRSSGTLSIASTASTASSMAESPRFTREMSAPPATTSSSTILESSHELLGLSLSDSRNSHSPRPSGITVPISARSSPSSSPDLSLSQSAFATSEPLHNFDSYSITSSRPSVGSAPQPSFDRSVIAPWDSPPLPEYDARKSRATSPLVNSTLPPLRPTNSTQSPPRITRKLSSTSTFCPGTRKRDASPPSPPNSNGSFTTLYGPLGSVSSNSRTSLSPESAATANQKRKGSVGGLLSLITRRGSKV